MSDNQKKRDEKDAPHVYSKAQTRNQIDTINLQKEMLNKDIKQQENNPELKKALQKQKDNLTQYALKLKEHHFGQHKFDSDMAAFVHAGNKTADNSSLKVIKDDKNGD